MKVQVQLSGQIRDYDRVYDSLMKNIVEPMEAEIVAAMWNDSNFDKFINLYKPKQYKCLDENEIENFDELVNKLKSNKRPESRPEHFLKAWYALKKANELTDADIIVKARTEVTYTRPIKVEEKILMGENMWVPNANNSLGISDLIAFGPANQINWYSHIYDYFLSYFDGGLQIHPERYIFHHLEQKNIKPYRFDFPLYLRGELWI